MKTGDTIQTSAGHFVLIDRVLPDRSARQWEAGWWAQDADDGETNLNEEREPDVFISDEGIVYGNSAEFPDCYDMQIGTV